jgi:hypothetical protein
MFLSVPGSVLGRTVPPRTCAGIEPTEPRQGTRHQHYRSPAGTKPAAINRANRSAATNESNRRQSTIRDRSRTITTNPPPSDQIDTRRSPTVRNTPAVTIPPPRNTQYGRPIRAHNPDEPTPAPSQDRPARRQSATKDHPPNPPNESPAGHNPKPPTEPNARHHRRNLAPSPSPGCTNRTTDPTRERSPNRETLNPA